jgi:SAM-dependent methyltransferase
MQAVAVDVGVRIGESVHARTVRSGSPEHLEAQRLLREQFGRVQSARSGTTSTYLEATETVASRTIPIVVTVHGAASAASGSSSPLLGTARLELPGAMLIESMILLRPGTPAEAQLAAQHVAEIGSFAPAPDLSRAMLLDVIDGIVAVMVQLARLNRLDAIWVFPRRGFMSLMRAEIPGVLTPYRFALSEDVQGWNEESAQLRHFRSLGLRGLGSWPDIYEERVEDLEADLAGRLALREARLARGDELPGLLRSAMVQAQRRINQDEDDLHRRQLRTVGYGGTGYSSVHGMGNGERGAGGMTQSDPGVAGPAPDVARDGEGAGQAASDTHFLPFHERESLEGHYLTAVVNQGGDAAREYKRMTYRLLAPERGMRVLDVGCGAGVDLAPLADLVGPEGQVVGVDHDPDRVREARAAADASSRRNITVFQGNAQELTFPNAEFDRVRADRVLQHLPEPARALGEMWRVLRTGGILTAIEPDWSFIAMSPAGPEDGNDDSVLAEVLGWCRRHVRQPLIGRRLHTLLRESGIAGEGETHVHVAAFSFTRWDEVDTVLQLSRVVSALAQEQPERRTALSGWLDAVTSASAAGRFFATVPLFFGYARKLNTTSSPTGVTAVQ